MAFLDIVSMAKDKLLCLFLVSISIYWECAALTILGKEVLND